MDSLRSLPNIGTDTERLLILSGIETPDALCVLGAEEAWLRMRAVDPSVCLHRLLALEGAIVGVKKASLPAERKAALRAFYDLHKLS